MKVIKAPHRRCLQRANGSGPGVKSPRFPSELSLIDASDYLFSYWPLVSVNSFPGHSPSDFLRRIAVQGVFFKIGSRPAVLSGGEEGCALFLLMVLLVGLYRFLFAL